MSWTSKPSFPLPGRWSPDPAFPASVAAWTPVIVRSVHGTELAVASDDGIVRLGVLSGAEAATAIDAGVMVLPGTVGAETATADDWGTVTIHAVGGELAVSSDRGVLGAWHRTETATAADSGLIVPGGLSGTDTAIVGDGCLVGTGGRGGELGVGADSGVGWFAWQASIDGQLTATGRIEIPPGYRYIDVILLGGGGGGAGGNQLGADGKGGKAGQYASRRWDRGESRNLWTSFYIEIGAGGGGGSRNNNGSGGAGGATKLWIDDPAGWAGEYLEAAGGSGGSGTNPPLGNDRPGKAPGNHTFQGITAVGGGQNSGVPGAGGEGGGGSAFPFNSGSGSAGARGQAWYRLSY